MNVYKKIAAEIILLLILMTACTTQKGTDIPIIYAGSNNRAVFSELFDEIIVVPLETDKSGLLGMMAMRIEVFQDKVFILNQLPSHKNILCFHHSGRFLFAIDRLGKGFGEYTFLTDFFIDRKSQTLILNTLKGDFYYFDLSGYFLKKVHTDDTYFNRQMCRLNDSTFLVFNDQIELPKEIDLLTVNPNTFDIKEISHSRNILSGVITPRLPLSIHHEHALYYDVNDTIFDVTDISNRSAKYAVDFGRTHQTSKQLIIQNVQNFSYTEVLEIVTKLFANNRITSLPVLFENNRFLAIGYINSAHSEIGNLKYSFLLYDKNSQQAYNSDNIVFDFLNLPNMGDFNILGKSDDSFYALYTPQWTPQSKETMLQSKYISEELRNYIHKGDDDNNPMLVFFK